MPSAKNNIKRSAMTEKIIYLWKPLSQNICCLCILSFCPKSCCVNFCYSLLQVQDWKLHSMHNLSIGVRQLFSYVIWREDASWSGTNHHEYKMYKIKKVILHKNLPCYYFSKVIKLQTSDLTVAKSK